MDVPAEDRSPLDQWLLSELNALVRDVTEAYETYDVPGATRPIEAFVDNLSNWYVRRSRRRFWKADGDLDKNAAYLTLYEALVTVAKLLAPAMPFLAEALYRNLVVSVDADAPDSVHLAEWPEFDPARIKPEVMDEMALVMRLVSLGHAARNSAQIKVRQPLASAAFAVPASQADTVRAYAELIADELNVKAVDALDEAAEVVTYSLNPLPQALGPRFGPDFPKIQRVLRDDSAARAYAARLLAGESVTVPYDGGKEATVSAEEVEVRQNPAEGYAVASEGPHLAALDITLTDDLLAEGLAREFIRRVQTLRRDADYNVEDHVTVAYRASERLAGAVEQFAETIRGETLADALTAADDPAGDTAEDYEFDGETLRLAVARAE